MTARRALMISAAVAAVVHLIALGSVPLMVTPDGHDYINWAQSVMDGTGRWFSPHRTPGYPFLLAAAFSVLGRGGAAVLVLNHLLAWGTCVLVSLTAVELGGPAFGLAAGLLFALEPWSLVWSTYALTETPAAFLAAAAAAAALLLRRGRTAEAVLLGVLLSAGCLMRPALQVLVPFLAAAWLLRVDAPLRRRRVLAATLAAAFFAASSPWLVYAGRRGVHGFARGSNWVLWYGTAFHGLLDPGYAAEPKALAAWKAAVGDGPATNDQLSRVVESVGAYDDSAEDSALGAWARASLLRRPIGYAKAGLYTLLWQLNAGVAGKPAMYDEMRLLARRPFLAVEYPVAPNFQGAGRFQNWEKFSMGWSGGVLAPYVLWWAESAPRGLPQIPLFLAALAAALWALARRDWGLAAFFAAPLALVAASCVLLMPVTRYGLPAWTLWYPAAAWLAGRLARRKQPSA